LFKNCLLNKTKKRKKKKKKKTLSIVSTEDSG